jgi:GSH-dependent disulfide-bond oxidoreductase
MLKFYFNGSPNPTKVALFLEEAGIPYEPKPIDTRKGDQFSAELTALNPNQKVPVIVDGDVTVFDSTAILLYLGEKTGKFMPEASKKAELLSWMMFIGSGIGPYSGQAVHFRHFAKTPQPYSHDRYQYEANRHFGIVDARLKSQPYMVGKTYTIADMNLWSWARMLPFILGDDAWAKYPNVKRLHDEITARPAAQRAVALKDKHAFKVEMDDAARAVMFKHVKA